MYVPDCPIFNVLGPDMYMEAFAFTCSFSFAVTE